MKLRSPVDTTQTVCTAEVLGVWGEDEFNGAPIETGRLKVMVGDVHAAALMQYSTGSVILWSQKLVRKA